MLPFTACIERPPLYRGGSASTETIPASSPSLSETMRFVRTVIRSQGMAWIY